MGFLDSVDERHVDATATPDELRAALGGPLPEAGVPPRAVVERLAAARRPGLVAIAGPALLRLRHRRRAAGRARRRLAHRGVGPERGLYVLVARRGRSSRRSPAAGCSTLLGLPRRRASVGLRHRRARWRTSPALAAARHAVLRARRLGRRGATACTARRAIAVLAGDEAHVDDPRRAAAARARRARAVAACRPTSRDGCAPTRSRGAGGSTGPAIVCAQAGNVNTGAFDPLDGDRRRRRARAARGCTSTARSGCGRPPARARGISSPGVERADSWADRRAQVAQRPLRLRARDRRATPRRTAPR